MNLTEYKDILVYVEQRAGTIQNVSFELISKARELAQKANQQVIAFIPGNDISETHAIECLKHGADKVYICNHKLLENYITEPYTIATTLFIQSIKPESVLVGATTIGRDLAPRVSARLVTGLTADCTSLDICAETGNLLMTRPAFGGNILATIICPVHRPQISTVRPGVMQREIIENIDKSKIEYFTVELTQADINIEIIEEVHEKIAKQNIAEAKVLVSAGRGIGKKENLKNLELLAKNLGGLVSGSRAIVDNGWLEHSQQVGQTGQTVRPELYIACGISGAIQHLAGMEESEYIIAINKNPTAPIFEIADLGIVGDVNQILPLVIDELNCK
jgi:electron transfer flavoprotein alpha subunit